MSLLFSIAEKRTFWGQKEHAPSRRGEEEQQFRQKKPLREKRMHRSWLKKDVRLLRGLVHMKKKRKGHLTKTASLEGGSGAAASHKKRKKRRAMAEF